MPIHVTVLINFCTQEFELLNGVIMFYDSYLSE